VDEDRIGELHIIGNPDKLHWVSGKPGKSEGEEQ